MTFARTALAALILFAVAPAAVTVASPALPEDVEAQRPNAERCAHILGEEATDPVRADQIAMIVEESCYPLKAALPDLMARFGGDPAVDAQLAE